MVWWWPIKSASVVEAYVLHRKYAQTFSQALPYIYGGVEKCKVWCLRRCDVKPKQNVERENQQTDKRCIDVSGDESLQLIAAAAAPTSCDLSVWDTKANSAFHPCGIGKWVPDSAGKAEAGIVHSVSGWTRGVQVKLWDPLRTRAIPERLRGVFTTRRNTNKMFTLPYVTIMYSSICQFSLISPKPCWLCYAITSRCRVWLWSWSKLHHLPLTATVVCTLITFLWLQYWSAWLIKICEHRKTCIFCVLSLVKPTKMSWNLLKIWSWNFTSCPWEPCHCHM